MTQIWISAAGLSLATVIGSIIGFGIKEVPHRWYDTILGFCAGIMLAASTVGLILPAAESAGLGRWWLILAGVVLGMLFLNLLDMVTPHLHKLTGLDEETHRNNASINHILLFVMAIALHKLPEGMAAGVGFNSTETSDAWAVTLGIAIQNIPEGMVVIAPLLLAGVSKLRTFIISLSIALLEVVGVWIGYGIGSISEVLLPVMLAFAGGAMLYVVSDEMIPETHAHGYQKMATYSLILGFVSLVFLDMAF
ncbi:MAG: ZIP family metal transporter [Bacteroidales bacterium]|nr:ZIP family metal transporter [Bacteroidales bacterium]